MTRQIAAAAITSGLLGLTLMAARFDTSRPPDALAAPLESIPTQIGEWKLVHTDTLPEDVLKNLNATTYISRTYRRGSLNLDFFVAYYATQAAGEDLHTPKNCLPGNGWEIRNAGSTALRVGGQPVTVNEFTIQSEQNRAVALYWYQTRDRIIANEYAGKMYLFWDGLTRGLKSASAVRIVVPDIPGGAAAGEEFAARILPEVQRSLGY
jgi:EpsI family protein